MAIVAIILSIYSYPALRTASVTRSLRLPGVTAADEGMYLTVSRMDERADGTFINPYYHVPLPYPIGYLKFRFGPFLFGVLDRVLAGRIWVAFFVWNLAWWAFLCGAGIWLFERCLPRVTTELVLAGTALLALFSLDGFGMALRTLAHGSGVDLLNGLPYIRSFTPQVAAPLLVLYFGLQIRALQGKTLIPWGIMALLQFLAFTAFPWATLVMAGTTAVAAWWYILAGPRVGAWRVVVGYLLLCSIPDIAFAFHRSEGINSGFPDQTSAIQFQPAAVIQNIGKLWILVAVMTLAIALTKRLRPELKWPLMGLGFSILLLKMTDAVIAERLFFVSEYIGYFYQPVIVTLFVFLAAAYFPLAPRPLRVARIASAGVVVLCIVYGIVMAGGAYRANLPYNLEQADLSGWLARGEVTADDLIITQFENSRYDDCEWIPLLSEAEVLYCRNAQVMLTPEQKRDVQRFRQVLYLYFDGKDHRWLENTTQFSRTGLYGELSSFRTPEEFNARIATLREEMRPLFDRVERRDPSVTSYFRRFRSVWVVQNRQNHLFDNARLGAYLDLKESETSGTLIVTRAYPK